MIHETPTQSREHAPRSPRTLRIMAGIAIGDSLLVYTSYEAAHPPIPIDNHSVDIDAGSTPQQAVQEAADILIEQNNLHPGAINNIISAAQDVSHEITEIEGSVQPGTTIEVVLYEEDHLAGPDSYTVSAHMVNDQD